LDTYRFGHPKIHKIRLFHNSQSSTNNNNDNLQASNLVNITDTDLPILNSIAAPVFASRGRCSSRTIVSMNDTFTRVTTAKDANNEA